MSDHHTEPMIPVLTEAAVHGLRLAATHRGRDQPLTTALVLKGLATADHRGEWDRLWLELTELDWEQAAAIADAPSPGAVPGQWEGVPLTPDLARAMALFRDLSQRHRLVPAPAALLAVALFADGRTGIARWAAGRGAPLHDVVQVIENDILGVDLGGSQEVLGRSAQDDIGALLLLFEDAAGRRALECLGADPERAGKLAGRARRYGVYPAPASGHAPDVLDALARSPSPGLTRLLHVLSLEPAHLAFAARRFRAGDRPSGDPFRSVRRAARLRLLSGITVALLTVVALYPRATPLYLVAAAIPLFRFPRFPGWASLLLLLPLAEAVSPWILRVQVLLAVSDWLLARWSRRLMRRSTGLWISVAGARRTVRAFSGGPAVLEVRAGVRYAVREFRLDRDLLRTPPITWTPPPAPAGDVTPPATAAPMSTTGHGRPPTQPGPTGGDAAGRADAGRRADVLRSLRRRTLGWRAASVVAVVIGVVAVVSSPSWLLPLPEAVVPPYEKPAVQARILAAEDVGRALGKPVTETRDGPLADGVHASSAPLARDTVDLVEVGSWHRQWLTNDQKLAVRLQLVHYRAARLARQSCEPNRAITLPGTDSAGFIDGNGATLGVCAHGLSGTTGVSLALYNFGGLSDETLVAAARQLMSRQLPGAALLGEPAPRPANSYTRSALNRLLYATVILLASIGMLTILLDRAPWRRLVKPLAGRRSPGLPVVAVGPVASHALATLQALALGRLATYLVTLRVAEARHLGYIGTAAALVAAFAVAQLAEQRIRRRRRGATRVFTGWVMLPALLAMALTAGLVAGATCVVILGVTLIGTGVNPVGANVLAARFGLLLIVAGWVVALIALLPFTVARRLGMARLRAQADQDTRPPVLLLRSFADDRRVLRSRNLNRASVLERVCLRRRERFEEVIATNLGVFGPVEAISEPGQRLPPALGAVRREVPNDGNDDRWREVVRERIGAARLVCVTLGRTHGVVWEIGQVRTLGVLGRTIFTLPPLSPGENALRLRLLAYGLGIPWEAVDPGPEATVLAVACPTWWDHHPILVVGSGPDDVSYDAALETAVALIEPDGAVAPEVRAVIGTASTGLRPASALRTPEPPLLIWAPGKVHRPKGLLRRPWLWSFTLTPLVTVVSSFAFAQSLDDVETVPLNPEAVITAIAQDRRSTDTYGVVNRHDVVRLDLGARRVTRRFTVDERVTDLVVDGNTAIVGARESGRLTAHDIKTGATLWQATTRSGFRGLAVDDSTVTVVVPAERVVQRFSLTNGTAKGRQPVPGTPWDVAVADGHVFVALADQARVLDLDARTLRIRESLPSVRSPQELTVASSALWAYSPVEHRLAVVRAGPPGSWPASPITTQNQEAVVSTNGRAIAVLGLERVSVFEPGGAIQRRALLWESPTALTLLRDGSLLVGDDGAISRLAPAE